VYGIAHNGTNFAAVGQFGRAAYSANGVNWSVVQVGPFDQKDILAIASDGAKFVAVGKEGKAAFSTDHGANWTWIANKLLGTDSSGNAFAVNTITFGDDKFIAAGDGGRMKIIGKNEVVFGSGTDGGNNWESVNSRINAGILSLAHNGAAGITSIFIAAGHNGGMSQSSDGKNWISILPGAGANQNKFTDQERITCIAWGNEFIAGGNAYSGNTSKLTYSQ
jgi:hypothetical protein